MTDLGETTNLDLWLSSEPGPSMQDVERIAATLGQFHAEFYNSTQNPTPEMLERASNKILLPGWYNTIVEMAREVLAKEGVADYDVLVGRVEDCYDQYGETETCLGIVDLLGWQYFNRPEWKSGYRRLGVFRSVMCLFRTSRIDRLVADEFLAAETAIKRTRTFIGVFLRNYDIHARRPSPRFKRQTLIALGTSMLLQSSLFSTDLKDTAIRLSIESGLGCLRAAGDSEKEIDTTWFDETLTAYEGLFEKVTKMSITR